MTAPESVTITLPASPFCAASIDWRYVVEQLRAPRLVVLGDIADQIEAQLPKPKPEEPKGLGAVVKDRSGSSWLRVVGPGFDRPWAEVGVNKHYGFAAQVETETSYSHIDAVAVLSEGVTA